jgi:hypothetical protein
MDVNQLKTAIETLIQNDNFDVEKLKELLAPIATYVDNPVFIKNITDIVNIVTTDKNGDKKFDINDLKLFSNDPIAITSLISSILMIIYSIPELKFKYNQGATEELIFKILFFVFLVIVPTQTKMPLTSEDKTTIVNCTLIIYDTIKNTQIVQDLSNKISNYFKTSKCKCCTPNKSKQDILDNKFPSVKLNLEHSMNNIKQKK